MEIKNLTTTTNILDYSYVHVRKYGAMVQHWIVMQEIVSSSLLKSFLFLAPKGNSCTVKCNTRMSPLLHNFNKCPIETHDSASVKLSTS